MNKIQKTKQQLLEENQQLKERLAELENRNENSRHYASSTDHRSIIEQTIVGVYIIQDGLLKYVNPKLAEIFGYKEEELSSGFPVSELVHPDDRALVAGNIRKRVTGEKQSIRYRFRGCRKDGSTIYVEVHGSRSQYEGKPAVIGALLDISENVEAEEALAKSENKYRTLVNQLLDVVFVTDAQGNWLYLNKAWKKITGFSVDECIGRNYSEALHPDDYDKYIARFREDVRNRVESTRVELRYRRKDDSFCWVEVHARLSYDEAGNLLTTSGLIRDINTQKSAEQKISEQQQLINKIIHTTPNPIYVFDIVENRNVFRNHSVATVIGYSDEEIIAMGENLIPHIMHPDDRDSLNKHFARVQAGKDNEVYSLEYRMKAKDGKWRWFYSTDSVFKRDENGRVTQIIGTAQDITEKKHAERVVRESVESYRVLFDNASDGIFITDKSGAYAAANSVGCEMLGYGIEELKELTLKDVIDPEDLKARPIDFETLLKGKTVVSRRRLIRKDGSRLEAEISAKLLPDGNLQGIVRDVTERDNIEKALRVEKEFSESIIDSIPGAFFLLEGDKRILRWNKSMEKFIGFSKKEIKKMKPVDFFKNADKKRIRAALETVLKQGSAVIEADLVAKNGQEVPFLFTGKRIFVNGAACVLGVGINILERKSAEKELRAEKELSDLTIGSIPGLFYQLNAEGNFDRWNKNWVSEAGYSHKEMSEKNALDLFKGEDKRLIAENIRKVFDEGETTVEASLFYKNGSSVPYLFTGTRVFINNQMKLIGVGIDVSDRNRAIQALRESKERFRKLVESTHAVTWEADLERKFFGFVGPQAKEMLGYDLKDWYDGHFWKEHIHEDDYEATLAAFKERVTADNEFELQYRFKHQNGEAVWLQDIISVIYEHGLPKRLQGFLVDITERKQAEAERESLEEQLRHAQKLETIGTLAGGIAHDFNNILGPIFGYTELALYDLDNKERLKEELKQVLKAANRAKDLTSQILLFSRAGEEERKPLRLPLIIKEVIKFLKASIPKTIRLEYVLDENCNPIMANATQIHQVITNLCTNAYHAMREKGGVLKIELESIICSKEVAARHAALKEGKGYAVLAVSDTGTGIDPALVSRIFEPFFTTKEIGEGTGLGLSVVHGIVAKHGGDISVQSAPGKGTTFTVYLPTDEQVEEKESTEEQTVPHGNETVLCVDDEEDIVMMEKMALERLGYNVLHCSSAGEALELFKKRHKSIDAVISDQTMPQLTGLELTRQINQIKPQTPVILLTGYSETVSDINLVQAGIKKLLLKPFNIRELAEALRSVLDGRN